MVSKARGRTSKSGSSIDFWIPRDAATAPNMPSFQHINASTLNLTSSNQLATFTIILANLDQSVFINIDTKDDTVSYLLLTKFSQVPIMNSSTQTYDSFTILCSNTNLIQSDDFNYYLYFSSSGNNVNSAASFSYGLRELSANEYQTYCVNKQAASVPPVLLNTTSFNFTADFKIRTYSSGCYYIDASSGAWIASGLIVQSDTTLDATHCKSQTLQVTSFQVSGGIIPLPSAIDFGYVFTHAGFLQNLTIYLTVIIVTSVYIIMLVFCRLMDKKDEAKCAIHWLADNNPDDLYFYELIVHTSARQGAQTDSKVFINLSGQFDETTNRRLKAYHKGVKVFQRGSVNTFVLSVKK
jgi:hypothetical protein